MGKRRSHSRKHHKRAVPALGLLLVLTGAAPVIASQSLPTDCAELDNAGLQIPIVKLAAATAGEKPVTKSESAALNARPSDTADTPPSVDVPAGTLSEPGLYDTPTTFIEPTPADDTDASASHAHESTNKLPDIRTRFPGVSSAELKRFKRQMYRRDI